MSTQTHTQFFRIARTVVWAVLALTLPTISLAAESPSFRLYDEFPNYGDNAGKTSGSFRMDSDGTTWFTETTRSTNFILQPTFTVHQTGGSTGGSGAGSAGGGGSAGAGGDVNVATGGGGRRPTVVIAENNDPEKPTNTDVDKPTNTDLDKPHDPVVKLPEESPPAAPTQDEPVRESEAPEVFHDAAPFPESRGFDVVGKQVRTPSTVETKACPPLAGMHGAAFDYVQSCGCGAAGSCCTRVVTYLGYMKWVLLILLLVCADLLAIVILLIGKVRLLEERVHTKPAPRPRTSTRKKA